MRMGYNYGIRMIDFTMNKLGDMTLMNNGQELGV